jgi:hypothetical protein
MIHPGLPVSGFGPSRRGKTRLELQWLIVGGGLQGTYLSLFLTRRLGVPSSALRVLDAHAEPLHFWKVVTKNVGMDYLRSPAVHNLDIHHATLQRLAVQRGNGKPSLLLPYRRPLLSHFNLHSDEVVRRYRLNRLRLRGTATGLEPFRSGYRVAFVGPGGEEGSVTTERVLLALGRDRPEWPSWAADLKRAGAAVFHIFETGLEKLPDPSGRRVTILGAGLSGALLAIKLARLGAGEMVLLDRHTLRVRYFDSEPGWQGKTLMQHLAMMREPERRRALINRSRHGGSITPEVKELLDEARSRGHIGFRQAEVKGTEVEGDRLAVHTNSGAFNTELLILATGFAACRPGGSWLDRVVRELKLPCGSCGFPVIDRSLQWRRGLFATGSLAELELGPVAPNISGAHRAAERLAFFRNELYA